MSGHCYCSTPAAETKQRHSNDPVNIAGHEEQGDQPREVEFDSQRHERRHCQGNS